VANEGQSTDITSLFAPVDVELERRPDGSAIFRSKIPPAPYARCVGDWLEAWAQHAPHRIFLAERQNAPGWTTLSYAQALNRIFAVGTWILANRLSNERPVLVLSENSIEHAILALAAMHVGVPVATLSPPYSLASKDHETLKAAVKLLQPGAIFADNLDQFAPALSSIAPHHTATIFAGRQTQTLPTGAVRLAQLQTQNIAAVAEAFAQVSHDTIARFLFTSGSTGFPKAVINTQRMLTSNQAAKAQTWPLLDEAPITILDWLPWSHTFGANHNFNMVLRAGGTLYIDGGKPTPQLFETSIDNLREVVPTIYFNVPRGFDMLISVLERDQELSRRFFSGVKIIFYSGAALPQNLWDALEKLSVNAIGRVTPMVSSWGATETAPIATDCHFQASKSGNIGVPVPGIELKLLPSGDKLEIRVRGPNVFPGYWKAPDASKAAFDDENFYRIGDAVRFADPKRPEKGLYFDGRVSEDFKLTTGSWVNVGVLRTTGIAALAPVAQDIVVAGHNTDAVAFLIFPNVPACRALGGLPEHASVREMLDHPTVREAVQAGLRKLKEARGGSSVSYATRAILMDEPPQVDVGEITDKGYINQRAVLRRRSELIRRLSDRSDPACIACD
jgi:feruloyl-CoA synthase